MHRVEHAAVVGDEEEGALVGVEGGFELFDGRQVQVVGRLVEDQQVDASALEEGQRGSRAFARGEGGRGAYDVVRLEAELGQERADVRRVQFGDRRTERVEEVLRAVEQRAGLVDLADQDSRAQGGVPGVEGTRPRRASSRVDLPAPFAPVTATRSAQSI
ncbi:hypothetical protein SHKM778_37960 [Streptomyces sp. KM77-8]|uniref:Uncharacterized protein n=1 Tax=Streptomyces haneummycinicus TaxID=3074435 RepID=A0AAT9HIU7_9ACTN